MQYSIVYIASGSPRYKQVLNYPYYVDQKTFFPNALSLCHPPFKSPKELDFSTEAWSRSILLLQRQKAFCLFAKTPSSWIDHSLFCFSSPKGEYIKNQKSHPNLRPPEA